MESFEEFCGGSEFWNTSLLLNNTWPEFTPCFRYTALVWVPCTWLWVTSPVYFHYLRSKRVEGEIRASYVNTVKVLICVILTLLAGFEATVGKQNDFDKNPVSTAFYVGCAVKAVTFLLAAVLTVISRKAEVTSPCNLFLFWFLTFCAHLVPFYTVIVQQGEKDSFTLFTVFMTSFTFITLQFVIHCFAEPPTRDAPPLSADGRPPSPEVRASFPSKLTFHWVTGLVLKGYKASLVHKDVWELPYYLLTSSIISDFTRRWTRELAASLNERFKVGFNTAQKEVKTEFSDETTRLLNGCTSGKEKTNKRFKHQPSLFWVLFRNFYPEMFCSHSMRLVADVLQFANPILLRALMTYIENKGDYYAWQGWMLVFSFFVVTFFYSMFFNQNSYRSYNIAMKIKTALVAAIYRKSLTMNNEAKREFTAGSVVNLMAIDCQRIQDVVSNLWIVLSAPLQIAIAFSMLNDTLGVSFLAGVAVIVALIPINARISVLSRRAQAKQLVVKDDRIKMMNEILSGIKVLKMYAWEKSFEDKINVLRDREVKLLRTGAMLNTINSFCWICSPVLVTMASFITYVQLNDKHILEPDVAFVSLSLFNILRQPLNMLPAFISDMVAAHVSISRIRNFLSGEDIHCFDVIRNRHAAKRLALRG